FSHCRYKLDDEPISQNDEGRDGHQDDEEKSEHLGPRIQYDVGAHHAADGSAGADRWGARMEVEQYVQQAGANSTEKIEDQITQVAEVVFHIVPEYIDTQHVAQDVRKAAVQAHAGDQGQES